MHPVLRLGLIILLSLSCQKEMQELDSGLGSYWGDYIPFEVNYNAGALEQSVQYQTTPRAIDTITWIKECSGMSASLANPGYAWVQNDSGNDPFLYLMRLSDGKLVWTVYASNWTNVDWEDVEVVQSEKGAYVYIGDFGDNQERRSNITLYRIEEPIYNDSLFQDTTTLAHAGFVQLLFPDKPHDVEAMFSDVKRGDMYLVSKLDSRSMLFAWPFKESIDIQDTLVYCGSFPFNYVTAASSSSDGKQVAMRTYQQIMAWTIHDGVDFRDQLSQKPIGLPYGNQELQGESIALTDSGYFLLAEAPFGIKPVLYFYPKH